MMRRLRRRLSSSAEASLSWPHVMVGVGACFCTSHPIEPHGVLPLLPALFHPDRWLLWFGTLFVLSVYFFPTGIVGKLREQRHRTTP